MERTASLPAPLRDRGRAGPDRRRRDLPPGAARSHQPPASLLLGEDGTTVPLDVERWHGAIDEAESLLLETLDDPVLDIGCGPGRVGAALSAAGRAVLGIDPAPTAVAWARDRGAPALCRSVFERLPDEGRWASALLLDGNIGIGGDPSALLARIHDLLAPGGQVVAEVTAPGSRTGAVRVRLGSGDARLLGPWFLWATVSADAFPAIARSAGLLAGPTVHHGRRWFARATRP